MTVLAELEAALGTDIVLSDPARMEKYRTDWTKDPDAGVPLAVVRPSHVDQVQTTVKIAAKYRTPIVPRGQGTGLSGGATAIAQGIVLSTERLTKIEIDPATRTARVEPGALNADVKRAAAEHGLWYPPDPASYEICSIGGNLATNAGGLCCVKYGVTTDYVLGMDVVLADGTKITLGGPRIKDVAGYSLTKLFVGSEGTLGVITEGLLRLVPAQTAAATVVATFTSVVDAAEAVVAVGASIRPSMMEFMDQNAINAVEDLRPYGLDRSAAAMLIAQSDAPGSARLAEIELMEQVFAEHGATEVVSTADAEEGAMFTAARRGFFQALEPRGTVLHEDAGVPIPQLPKLLDGVREIAAQYRVEMPVVAHAGDGNSHPNVVYDPSDAAAAKRAHDAFDAVMDLAIGLGGTITGEHGVGRQKQSKLEDQLGTQVLQLNRVIKNALDPQGILNPGAVLLDSRAPGSAAAASAADLPG